MSKKHSFKKVAALLLGIALTVGSTGCNFLPTNSHRDLIEKVATVDISDALAAEEDFKDEATDIKDLIKILDKDILKRDLMSAYLSTGYQYVESYGYSYEDTFNMLLDNLINRKIILQYAVAYYLNKDSNISKTNYETFKGAELTATTDATVKKLLEENEEVLLLKYLLTDGGKSGEEYTEEYDKAVYSLHYSFNSSLDSLEKTYISEEEEDHDHEEARTLPTGVDTEREDYYSTNYKVYTGFEAADADLGEYEKQDGSSRTTRQKAYNSFLTNLHAYSLIDTDNSDGVVESTADITKLNYYYMELSSVLGQSLINKYFDSLEEEVSGDLTAAYMNAKYAEHLAQDTNTYASDPTAFGTALDSAAEGTFMTYGLENYGYVYNILIPFSASQNIAYAEAKSRGLTSDQLYVDRREIMKEIKGSDLRDTWISEHDHANYSYEKDGKTYFFEDNLKENPKYEKLDHYAGTYAYNEEKVDIDQFIDIFENHINSVVGKTVANGTENAEFYNYTTFKKDNSKKVDYSKFTYYTGSVTLDSVDPTLYFDKTSEQYKALSAVNELMFAYSTDTGCLNKYMGYSVTPYTTNFVKEFEWAAQYVVEQGVGSYAVCATDFGWHIIYCSFKYAGDAVYGDEVYDEENADNFKAQIEAEGTFANLFYEYVQESAFANHATEEQNRVLLKYSNDNSVTRFQKAYQDLLDMDN